MKKVLRAFALAAFLAACGQQQPAPETLAAVDPGAEARTNADFGLRLGLIEGHLIAARALIDAGQAQNALPHFGHPVRELYSDMLPVIARRGGEQFDRDLIALEGLAAGGPSPALDTAFAATLAKVRAARDLIPAENWASDAYILQIAADTVSTCAQEYRNAIVAGRVNSLIEYHDTRGFLIYLTDLLAQHQGSDPRLAQAAAIVANLRTAVEPLNPPATPVMTPEQFEEQTAALRTLVGASADTAAPVMQH